MAIWIPYFSVAFFMWLFSSFVPDIDNDDNRICYKKDYEVRRVCFAAFCVAVLLIVFCAFKQVSAGAIDEYAYRNRFVNYFGKNIRTILTYSEGEYVNGFLVWIATRLFDTSQGIFIVYGALTALFYLGTIRKYSRNYSYAVVLLMVTGIINTSLNITQQSLACAIIAYNSDLILNRKFLKYTAVVLLCCTIHSSSIIAIMFYFLYTENLLKDRKTTWRTALVAVGIFVVYCLIPRLAVYIPFLSSYTSDVTEGHAGVRLITILINCVPALIAVLGKKMIREDDRISVFCSNMCILHGAIYAVCIVDRYIARLAMFTDIFCVLFLARVASSVFNRESEKLFRIVSVILYSIELFLRMRGTTYMFNFVL